ncbi:MAG: Spy/CpxP family protein refolding chaperone [Xanthobacteraceae bacterium]|uniref:Spy/CpxP family protein refolding chaperone n=1 Tax=Pseudolabrys sp. TaxID=1960880 RepID=UPI003D11A769
MRVRSLVVLAVAFVPAFAAADTPRPYAGFEARPIKALSEQQISDLRAGRGMGFALAAELNGYPGPVHVLDLADKLGLDAAQRARMQALFDAMKAEAVPLGETLIAQEVALDRAFSSRTVTEASLSDALSQIGRTQAALRNTHLKYHLETRALLSAHQIALYGALRGYGDGRGGGEHKHRH